MSQQAPDFVALGGPGRVLRRAKRVVFGPEQPLPKSMLPNEIDASLSKLGTDGERVRGLLEREFASYLEERGPEHRRRDLSRTGAILAVAALRPLVVAWSRRLAGELFAADDQEYSSRLEQVRARLAAAAKRGQD